MNLWTLTIIISSFGCIIIFKSTALSYDEIGKELNHRINTEDHPLLNMKTYGIKSYISKVANDSSYYCFICSIAVGMLQSSAKKGEAFDLVKITFVNICIKQRIQNKVVCTQIFDTFGPIVLECLKIAQIGPKEICSMLLGEYCPTANPMHEWTTQLPNVTKPLIKDEPLSLPQAGKPMLKVLQLNDIHLDLEYTEESNANCEEPICCRNFSTDKKLGVKLPAGRWGSYNCDAPEKLIKRALHHIARNHPDVDYIMWLGDTPPHDVWRQTKNSFLNVLKRSVSLIKRIFPKTLVLPNPGNHDAVPIANFAPPWVTNGQFSAKWLYEELNILWKDWLPRSEENTILRGAYYSVLVRPNFRVISINTNFCDKFNWWLYVNSTDPAQQLEWLANQLQKAENDGEKVHIIGHIPPGTFHCLKTWSRNYYEIINRYESVITAQFFGHTHYDEYEMFYDSKDLKRPISIGYIGPSITPHVGTNPAYRIYYIDGDHADSTREVLDHETWSMDLDRANSIPEECPHFFKTYSAKDTYNMTSLRSTEWDKLIYKMRHDSRIFDQFYRHYHRDSPASSPYTTENKKTILCDLKSGKSSARYELCKDFVDLV